MRLERRRGKANVMVRAKLDEVRCESFAVPWEPSVGCDGAGVVGGAERVV